jgi:hypothetical protein
MQREWELRKSNRGGKFDQDTYACTEVHNENPLYN